MSKSNIFSSLMILFFTCDIIFFFTCDIIFFLLVSLSSLLPPFNFLLLSLQFVFDFFYFVLIFWLKPLWACLGLIKLYTSLWSEPVEITLQLGISYSFLFKSRKIFSKILLGTINLATSVPVANSGRELEKVKSAE